MSPFEEADADTAEDAPVYVGIANAVLDNGNPGGGEPIGCGGGCGVVKGNGPGGGPGGLLVRRAVSSFTRLCSLYNPRLSGQSQ